MKHQLVTAPAVEPVSLADARLHCRVDSTDEDTWFTTAIAAARRLCEEYCGRAFITQTWRLTLDEFPHLCDDGGRIVLPRCTLQSVDSIEYIDEAGDTQTLNAALYQVDTESEPGLVLPAPNQSWPSTESQRINAVTIEYTAGYGDAASDVDPLAIQAVKVLVAHWYENREAVLTGTISKEMEMSMRQMLSPLWHGHLW